MKTTTTTHRVGELKNGARELYIAETQEVIARVESDLGPAMIGDMTEEQARSRFPEAFGDEDNDNADEDQLILVGCEIQHDRSGVGHCWVPATAGNCPPSIQEEIEGEIIDGKVDTCRDWVGSNGEHYRWE